MEDRGIEDTNGFSESIICFWAQERGGQSWFQVTLSRTLGATTGFWAIEEYWIGRTSFEGTLRPYQQADTIGFDFLNEFKFGGCLADDMGFLGKTVPTSALLAFWEREESDIHFPLIGHANFPDL